MTIQFNHLPVDAPLRITSNFGPRNTGISGASTNHKGVDLGRDLTKTSTNITSVTTGTVINNYWNKYRGWVIIIQHNGFKTLYQHLKTQSPLAVGTPVKAGTVLGIMGNSSDKSVLTVSIHLHFELIVNNVQIDSAPYLKNIVKEDDEVVDTTKINVNGVVKEVSRILKDGTNFVQLKELATILGLEVGYD